jgi:hypothetical protein
MVCVTLPDFLARGDDLHLAVSARVGTHRDGSFFSGGNSYDHRYWRCMLVWNWRGTSLAYSGATFDGGRHNDVFVVLQLLAFRLSLIRYIATR